MPFTQRIERNRRHSFIICYSHAVFSECYCHNYFKVLLEEINGMATTLTQTFCCVFYNVLHIKTKCFGGFRRDVQKERGDSGILVFGKKKSIQNDTT